MTNPDIVKQLARQTEEKLKGNKWPNCGLLGGNFGEALFLILSGHADTGSDNIMRILKMVNDRAVIPTYCNGLAGLGSGLIWLEQQGIVEGVSENLSDFDYSLLIAMRRMIVNDNFDFLHGAIGIGLYFVDRISSRRDISLQAIKELVDAIKRKAIYGDDGSVCLIYYTINNEKKYNISLSHGLSGTALFLCRVINTTVDDATKDTVKELLKGISKFLMAQLQDIRMYGCYFPTFPVTDDEQSRKSRLGWCYGDLGVLLALMKIGETTGDDRLKQNSIERLVVEAKYRRNLLMNSVHDACICHGSGGIVLILKYMHDITNNSDFFEAYNYWLGVTKKFMTTADGEVHFKMYDATEQSRKIESCLLEGDCGIGLLLNENYSLLNHFLLID